MKVRLIVALMTAGACVASAGDFWSCEKLDSEGTSFSWTLTSRLGSMLCEAEQMFGARDKNWTILGCQYCRDIVQPENWYPGYPKRNDIVINLVGRANVDMDIALYQCAHEIVHALSPKVGKPANVLEEGAAVWFSVYYVKKATGKDPTVWMSKKYRYAYDAVAPLLRKEAEAIKKLRRVQPCFKEMTQATFERAGVKVSGKEVTTLLQPFSDVALRDCP